MKTYYDLESYDNGMMTGVLQSDIEKTAVFRLLAKGQSRLDARHIHRPRKRRGA